MCAQSSSLAIRMVAGYETLANTLGWTWYLLYQHPRIEPVMWVTLRLKHGIMMLVDRRLRAVATTEEQS